MNKLILLAALLLAPLIANAQSTFSAVVNTASNSPILASCHAKYDFSVDGGAVSTITPATNCTIPTNAVIVSSTINSTTAVTSGGAATIAVGTAATGGATTSFLAATGKASFTSNALLAGAVTYAAPLKVTGAGAITLTVATAALTAGVIEVWVQYYVANN